MNKQKARDSIIICFTRIHRNTILSYNRLVFLILDKKDWGLFKNLPMVHEMNKDKKKEFTTQRITET